jgi:uncharacterized protein (DUF1015 family)
LYPRSFWIRENSFAAIDQPACDVDVVVIAACGERAGEVVETLKTFPTLIDPRTNHIKQYFAETFASDAGSGAVKGYDGFTHQLWRLDDPTTIKTIVNELKEKILFIADGHHRYQTSINYATEKKEQTGNKDPNASFNYIMIVLCNMFDPGLSILPTYRLN